MVEVEISSGQETIITPWVLLRFLWMSDHWKHEIISVAGCRSIPRIWSIEGPSDYASSGKLCAPHYDQLRAHIDPAGIARATLSGRSGSHHFSTTFAVEERPDGVAIEVEVAGECPRPADRLAATYLIEASSGKLSSSGPITIVWPNPECHLVFEATPPTRAMAHEAGMGTIRLQALDEADPASSARHLSYRWRWTAVAFHQIWDRDV